MSVSRIESDLFVNGSLAVSGSVVLPTASIADAQLAANAAVSVAKQQHLLIATAVLCDHATNAATKRVQQHRVRGATATLLKFGVAASVAATGDSTITVDLKKNGSSILSATISLTSATAAHTLKEPAGYSSTALVAGDVLEAEITAVSAGTGTLPKGVACYLEVDEAGS